MDVANGSMGIYPEKDMILALDPGRDKTGFAFVDMQGNLLASGIFESSQRDKFFENLGGGISFLEGNAERITHSRVKFIALGNGTGSKEFHDYVKRVTDYEIKVVNEKNTTLEARELYWRLHEPSFLMRLIPKNLRVPDRILDDLAAWAIGLRALKVLREKI